MSVDTQHPEYDKYLPAWRTTRDCVEGPDAVRKRRTAYLPKPNPSDLSPENSERYEDYLKRANFVNFTGSTLDGMLGMVFREPIELDLPQAVAYLADNINGAGLTFDQMARDTVAEVLQTGRQGLLVDYPAAPEGLTRAQETAMQLRANVLGYAAEDCINWATEVIGGVRVLSLVVLRESMRVWEDEYKSAEVPVYRVLRLIDGAYWQAVFDREGAVVVAAFQPRKAGGGRWDRIPFVFCGSQNNDPTVDRGPLYDIAAVNIAHYRNSADFEESCFLVGQPTPVFAGLNQSWVDNVMTGGVMLGSRTGVLLPEGGSGSLLQASPNQMPERGMELKEQQMVKIGARIIQDVAGVETATAAHIRYAGQNSKLSAVVGNVESALVQCVEWVGEFMGAQPGAAVVELNRDFYARGADPQLIMASIQLLDRGVIAVQDIRGTLRDYGIIERDRTDEQIDSDAGDAIL